MIKCFLLSWVIFFALWGFFMMPGFMTFAIVMGIIGGIISARLQIKKDKNRRLNMTLNADDWKF